MKSMILKGARKRLVILAFSGLACVAISQGATAMGSGHEPDFNRAAEKLVLDEAQTEQFVSIMTEQHEKRKALRESLKESGTKKGYGEKMKPLHDETLGKLSEILSSEQLAAFEEMRENRRQYRH